MSFLHSYFSFRRHCQIYQIFLTFKSRLFMNIVLYYMNDPVGVAWRGVAWRGVHIGANQLKGRLELYFLPYVTDLLNWLYYI